MLEVIRQDYITTARAKGQKESKVIYGHALQNAMMPVITVIGSRFAGALAGSMVVESIFSIPGMGNYLINAINSRDYAVVQDVYKRQSPVDPAGPEYCKNGRPGDLRL